jgi:hypothetical protein
MAPIDTGRYIIANRRYKYAAILRSDANNHSGIIARSANDASELVRRISVRIDPHSPIVQWNIDRLSDGTYKIRSQCHSSFANTKTSVKASRGDVVVGGSRPQQWKIVEMSSKGAYWCAFIQVLFLYFTIYEVRVVSSQPTTWMFVGASQMVN